MKEIIEYSTKNDFRYLEKSEVIFYRRGLYEDRVGYAAEDDSCDGLHGQGEHFTEGNNGAVERDLYERVDDNMGDAADDTTDEPGIFKVRQKLVGDSSGDERPETF